MKTILPALIAFAIFSNDNGSPFKVSILGGGGNTELMRNELLLNKIKK